MHVSPRDAIATIQPHIAAFPASQASNSLRKMELRYASLSLLRAVLLAHISLLEVEFACLFLWATVQYQINQDRCVIVVYLVSY